MKNFIFAALVAVTSLCGIATQSFAQTHKASDANIYGHIIDAKTKEHIPYVTISVKGTTYGTVADATGHFFLKNLPEGVHTLIAESLSHRERC